MSWIPSDREVGSVTECDAPKRYAYTVKRIVDQETLWSLWDQDGWALAVAPSGREAVPIWPHEKFATECATGHWAGFEPRAIDLDAWINRWTPGMLKDNRLVAIFPTMSDKGVFVDPSRFDGDVQQEMQSYE